MGMRFIGLALLSVVLTAYAGGPATARSVDLGNAGGWAISYDDADNRSCTATGAYEGGTTLSVLLIGPDRTWAFAMVNRKWTAVVKDKEYSTQYIFNGRRMWKGTDRGVSNGLISYDIKSEFIEDFARSSVLEIRLGSRMIDRISLRGTRAAINALKNCYADHVDAADPFSGETSSAQQAAPTPSPSPDIDLWRMTTFSGKCRYQLFEGFLPCKDAVVFGEHSNGRLQLIFVSDQLIYSLSGGSDRQPNLNNYYVAVDTLRLTPSNSSEKPAEDKGMEGECHFTLNDGATEFYFIKCDVYNREKGTQYKFYLEDITTFKKEEF
jgi:hypothetical protein